jgi:hypothetical protein
MNNVKDQDDERNKDWLDELFSRDTQVDSDPVLISKVMSKINADVFAAHSAQTNSFQALSDVLLFCGPYVFISSGLFALIWMMPEFSHVLLRLAWDPLSQTIWFDGPLWAGITCLSLLVTGGMQMSKLRFTDFSFNVD